MNGRNGARRSELELLAPAGNMDSLRAAVEAGADAVYFGVGKMNARAAARNFDAETVVDAIAYCHGRGVAAHIALNTLLLDREIGDALNTAAHLYEAGADALIVQDWGLLRLLRMNFPDLPLHGSTQMSVLNADGVNRVAAMGVSRVVLGRECSVADIAKIAADSSVELEVFVQGAMCVSVSGQCLHSSLLGGRSGNRGMCAQPCRMRYESEGENGYLLSMKDQCQIGQLAALRNIGVASLKIEGRMKSAAYVSAVVGAYRRALDALEEKGTAHGKLDVAWGRNGCFSEGYSHGRDELIDSRDPSYAAAVNAAEAPEQTLRRLRVGMAFSGRVGSAAKLHLYAINRPEWTVTVVGEPVQPAQKAALTAERLRDALGKLGDTPYALAQCEIQLDKGAFLPISAVNALRREAIDVFQRQAAQVALRPHILPVVSVLSERKPARDEAQPEIVVQVATVAQAQAAQEAGADKIIAQPRDWRKERPLDEWLRWLDGRTEEEARVPVFIQPPPILLPHAAAQVERALSRCGSRWAGAVAGAIGSINMLRRYFDRVDGDYTLNATNGQSAAELRAVGIDQLSLSVECTAAQWRDIVHRVDGCGAVVYGTLPTMTLLHCPVRREQGCCGDCERGRVYIDRKGQALALRPFHFGTDERGAPDCAWQLFNALPMDMARFGGRLRAVGLSFWKLLFVSETPVQVAERVQAYGALRDGGSAVHLVQSTGGHFQRGFAMKETVEPRQRLCDAKRIKK